MFAGRLSPGDVPAPARDVTSRRKTPEVRMKRRLPVLLSLALVGAYLAPGAMLEALLRLQDGSLPPVALLVAYLAGAVLLVFPLACLVLPELLRRCRLEGAAWIVRRASLHALQLVLAFVPPWQIAAYFGADAIPRVLLIAGGAALLVLLLDPVFSSLGHGFFED